MFRLLAEVAMVGNLLGALLLLTVAVIFAWLARRAWRARRRAVRWGGSALAGLGTALAGCAGVLALVGVYRAYAPRGPSPVTLDASQVQATPGRIARGEHIARVTCAQCHSTTGDVPLAGGRDLAAEIPIPLGSLVPVNLTPAGPIAGWSDADLARALRDGADQRRRLLPVMASLHFRELSSEDLASVIAYVRSQPPTPGPTSPGRLTLLGVIMLGGGLIPVPPVPTAGPPAAPPASPTAAYGAYLVQILGCRDCHGEQLTGSTGGLAPKGPSLRVVQGWTEPQFASTLRTGVTPFGKQLDSTVMPWRPLGRMNDVELAAVYAYLRSLR